MLLRAGHEKGIRNGGRVNKTAGWPSAAKEWCEAALLFEEKKAFCPRYVLEQGKTQKNSGFLPLNKPLTQPSPHKGERGMMWCFLVGRASRPPSLPRKRESSSNKRKRFLTFFFKNTWTPAFAGVTPARREGAWGTLRRPPIHPSARIASGSSELKGGSGILPELLKTQAGSLRHHFF